MIINNIGNGELPSSQYFVFLPFQLVSQNYFITMEMNRKLPLFLTCCLLLGFGNLFAQFGAWQYVQPIAATNQTGIAQTDYQLRLVVNTQTLVSQGKMDIAGNDIRFGDACGATSYDYWIEDYMNTDTTLI